MDNKLFWKTIKPSLSDKLVAKDRIHLTEKDEIVEIELETAETLSRFFENVINNLKISKYAGYNFLIDSIENRTIEALLKFRNHPSILPIHERKKNTLIFILKKFP